MGRSANAKRARAGHGPRPVPIPQVTHEPAVPVNWPDGHARAQVTGVADDECIVVTIHGFTHCLHATTAQALTGSLVKALFGWEDSFAEVAEAMKQLTGSAAPPGWEFMQDYLARLISEE